MITQNLTVAYIIVDGQLAGVFDHTIYLGFLGSTREGLAIQVQHHFAGDIQSCGDGYIL